MNISREKYRHICGSYESYNLNLLPLKIFADNFVVSMYFDIILSHTSNIYTKNVNPFC